MELLRTNSLHGRLTLPAALYRRLLNHNVLLLRGAARGIAPLRSATPWRRNALYVNTLD